MNNRYNFIYSKLVADKDDVLGIIAYSIYKRQKIEFIKDFESRTGTSPTELDMQNFIEISNSPFQLEFYKNQSFQLMQNFLEQTLAEDVEKIEQEFDSRVHAELSKVKSSFMTGVFQSLVGSILFVLFLGIVVFFTWSLNQGFEKAVENAFSIEIESKK